jgi:hypothetical protein
MYCLDGAGCFRYTALQNELSLERRDAVIRGAFFFAGCGSLNLKENPLPWPPISKPLPAFYRLL